MEKRRMAIMYSGSEIGITRNNSVTIVPSPIILGLLVLRELTDNQLNRRGNPDAFYITYSHIPDG